MCLRSNKNIKTLIETSSLDKRIRQVRHQKGRGFHSNFCSINKNNLFEPLQE